MFLINTEKYMIDSNKQTYTCKFTRMNDPFFGLNWIIKLTSYLSFPENGKKQQIKRLIHTYLWTQWFIHKSSSKYILKIVIFFSELCVILMNIHVLLSIKINHHFVEKEKKPFTWVLCSVNLKAIKRTVIFDETSRIAWVNYKLYVFIQSTKLA